MKKNKKSFFEGSTKSIRLAFAGFVVAAVGVAIGFAAQAIRPFAYIAFGITTVGVMIGFAGIALGFFGGKKWN